MAKVHRESLQRSILKREDTGPRIKTTHKGELIIVENVRDSPRDSPLLLLRDQNLNLKI